MRSNNKSSRMIHHATELVNDNVTYLIFTGDIIDVLGRTIERESRIRLDGEQINVSNEILLNVLSLFFWTFLKLKLWAIFSLS